MAQSCRSFAARSREIRTSGRQPTHPDPAMAPPYDRMTFGFRPQERPVLQPQFASVADVKERLGAAGSLTDDAIATTVFLADRLGKPLLIEGPAGVGKTELAKSVATAVGAEL